MSVRPAAHVAVRGLPWFGYAFCTLIAFMWGWDGRLGFAALWAGFAGVYLWLIAGRPRPRSIVIALLRMLTGREALDLERVAHLERELGIGQTRGGEAP